MNRYSEEPSVGCLSHSPTGGLALNPGIEPVTLQFEGGCPTHRATPARTWLDIL